MGGPEAARIIWLEKLPTVLAHVLVVRTDAGPKDKPYNDYLDLTWAFPGQEITTEFVVKNGLDITDEVLVDEWKNL